jgi:hypothetical protein
MNRPTTIMLFDITLLVLALAASPQVSFAQANVVPNGVFQLNVAKSKFPGAPLKSQTLYFEGQKITAVGINAQGGARAVVFEFVEDGKPHPVTGFPAYDASTYTRVDPHTVNFTRMKDGKVVQTGTEVVSPDGKMVAYTLTNTVNGARTVQVYGNSR